MFIYRNTARSTLDTLDLVPPEQSGLKANLLSFAVELCYHALVKERTANKLCRPLYAYALDDHATMVRV